MYGLRRTSGASLALTAEHDALVRPRRRRIDWAAFDPAGHDARALDAAAALWAGRARQELCSLAHVGELATVARRLGAPLDWSGALARVSTDEVRHVDLCLRLCEALGRPEVPTVDPDDLTRLPPTATLADLRLELIATMCIGETISGRALRRTLRATDVPLVRDVVRAILVDEAFHGPLGWELAALTMRGDGAALADERAALAQELPRLFAEHAAVCGAIAGPAWARRAPEAPPGPNFGQLTAAGYARAFFDAMDADIVPSLVAIGLPEAEPAYAALLATLPDAPPAG
ncbi:MAG: ferritin-like domain-containing protein [Kofleriaceae bacterium]